MTDTETTSKPVRTDNAGAPLADGRAPAPDNPTTSRTWLAASIASAAAALAACGGGGGSDSGSSQTSVATAANATTVPATAAASSATAVSGTAAVANATVAGGAAGPLGQSRTYVTPSNDFDAARYLLQAQLNASDAEIASVRSLGYAGWLATQLQAVSGTTAWDWLNQRGYGVVDANLYVDQSYMADYALWWQLFNAPDGLRKRVALALSEIFVVSTNGYNFAWSGHLSGAWWDMLSANALGNFRKLLEDVTLHPAMGLFLNVKGSLKENAAGQQPDENYAREVMQLMTIGLVKLNPDGSMVTSGGVPVDTYGQADVTNLARVFSGYDLDTSANVATVVGTRTISNTAFARLPMVLKPANHSTQDVNFLGTSIPGATEGNAARKLALDALFNHANVGPFIGRQLIQRLVTSNPTPAYVGRVASAFADNGKGVRGDMAAVVSAILLDDEARGPAGLTSPTYGRLREPMLRFAQWGRTFGLGSAKGSWKIGDLSSPNQLSQSPLRSPSVFNFFRPGYVPPSTAIASGALVAPEFQLVNETSVSTYVNFMQVATRTGFYVNGPDMPQVVSTAQNGFDLTATYTAEKALVTDPAALVARLNLLLAAGQLSAATTSLIASALATITVTASSTDAVKLSRIGAAVLMVMASPEYLVQK